MFIVETGIVLSWLFSFGEGVDDCLFMQALVERYCYVNNPVELLEVVFIGHILLVEHIYVGFGLIKGQGKEPLVLEAKYHCLDHS